jgi:hypothetical protein
MASKTAHLLSSDTKLVFWAMLEALQHNENLPPSALAMIESACDAFFAEGFEIGRNQAMKITLETIEKVKQEWLEGKLREVKPPTDLKQ